MTLCIAANALGGGLSFGDMDRVVVAFDWRIETDSAGAETGFKLQSLGRQWAALISGDVQDAVELCRQYSAFLIQHEDITSTHLLEYLNTPIRCFRYAMAESLIQSKLAMTYDEFLNHGREQVPMDLRRQIASEIAWQQCPVQLILIGVVDGRLVVAKSHNFEIRRCEDFAVIGSGSAIAEANLYQRKHSCLCSLGDTIYSVYESKRLGEIAPGVGRETSLFVLNRDDRGSILRQPWSRGDKKVLEKQFKRYGPRLLKNLDLPPDIMAHEQLMEREQQQRARTLAARTHHSTTADLLHPQPM